MIICLSLKFLSYKFFVVYSFMTDLSGFSANTLGRIVDSKNGEPA